MIRKLWQRWRRRKRSVSWFRRQWRKLLSRRVARLYDRAAEQQASGLVLTWLFGVWPYLRRDPKAQSLLGVLQVEPSSKTRVVPKDDNYLLEPVGKAEGGNRLPPGRVVSYLEPGRMAHLYRDYLSRVVEGDQNALELRRAWNADRNEATDDVLVAEAQNALSRLEASGLLDCGCCEEGGDQ